MNGVLLASDDARARVGIAGALERAGHRVDRVIHLTTAARSADLSQIGVVIVALEQTLKRDRFIKEVRARHPRVPVIVLLDARTAWQANRTESLGASVVLTRPLRLEALIQQVTDILTPKPRAKASVPILKRDLVLRKQPVLA